MCCVTEQVQLSHGDFCFVKSIPVRYVILRSDKRVPSANTNFINPVNDVLTVYVYQFHHSILSA
jgi:hypothetical protein